MATSSSRPGPGVRRVVAIAGIRNPQQSLQIVAHRKSLHVRNAPLATVGPKRAACREGPKCDITSLVDHLVGGGEQFIRNGDAERVGRLEIDQKLKCRRLLDRQFAGVCALENLVHIESSAPTEPLEARTIAKQAACIGEFPKAVDRGKNGPSLKPGALDNNGTCASGGPDRYFSPER
jgi:hypothetical protein